MVPSVTTAIYLDKRSQRKDGTYPVKLRVTYLRKQKYYGIGVSLTEEDFHKATSARPRGEHKENQLKFAAVEERAIAIIDRLEPFTFPEFEKQFKGKHQNDFRDIFQAYQRYIDQLNQEDKIRTAEAYLCSLGSIKTFAGKNRLPYADISPDWLKRYERWMMDEGKSVTTLSIYLRCLRAIYNQAMQRGDIATGLYPFGKQKYQIPNGRNVKKALTLADVKKIVNYQPEPESTEARYRDYWLFSYLCNGINIKDMALLRYKDIDGDRITFIRAKTRTTTRTEQKPIIVPLLPPAKRIVDKWGNPSSTPETLVFPMLTEGLTAKEQTTRIRQETKQTNKYMRRIGEVLGIEKDITTYTARHTFSTVLKRSGAPIEFISESLGHTNLATTERYLDSFEDDVKRGYAERLLDFGEE